MPTYGYRCTSCSHEFERFQKISDPAIAECESCGGGVKKIIYPVGIQFKGSGFYVNDSRKPSASETGNGSAAKESSSSETGGSAGTSVAAPAASESKTASVSPAPAPPSPTTTSS